MQSKVIIGDDIQQVENHRLLAIPCEKKTIESRHQNSIFMSTLLVLTQSLGDLLEQRNPDQQVEREGHR